MVAGNVGGIPLQVQDGISGYLTDSVEECADRVTELLANPELAERMGIAGKEHVRKNFLITRYLRDYLQIFRDQAAGKGGSSANGAGARRGAGSVASVDDSSARPRAPRPAKTSG